MDDGPADCRAFNTLPLEVSTFVGRNREVAKVAKLVASSRLVTLTGTGGVGKTRLALRVADDVAPSFPDGVWVVELASVTDPTRVAQAVASVLGVRDQGRRRLVEVLAEHLHHRRLLLVLDNCEHLIDASAGLAEQLLQAGAHLSILATSREHLRIAGEHVWPVRPLSLPPAGQVSEPEALLIYNAIRLFCDRASQADPDFNLDANLAPAVAEICRRLDGIPLAIELAAARVGMLSPTDIVARLENRFAFLTSGSRTALPRHQTLEAALGWSHDLLEYPERTLFRRLSVFAGGFTLEAAEEVCTGAHVQRGQVFDLLGALVVKSLVMPVTAAPGGRFALLETLRDYGRYRLGEAGEAAELESRHAAWCLELAGRAEEELTGPYQQGWLERLDAEHDNLRAALSWMLSGDQGQAEAALELAGALTMFWRVRGHFGEGRRWLEEALAKADDASPVMRATALWGLGFLAGMSGDFDTAVPAVEQSLALAREVGDTRGAARALNLLGSFSALVESPLAGLPILEESSTLAREAGDAWCLADSLAGCGRARMFLGNAAAARPYFEECFRVASATGDRQGMRHGSTGLGWTAVAQGDYEKAEELLSQGLGLARQLGETYGEAVALSLLAEVATARGDLGRARALVDEGLAIARAMRTPSVVARCLDVLGCMALSEGDHAAAREAFDEALPLARQGRVAYEEVRCLQGLAAVAHAVDDIATAMAYLEDALEVARESGDQQGMARSLHELGWLAYTDRDLERSASLLQKALAVRSDVADRAGIADSLEAMATVAGERGHGEVAARLFGAATSLRDAGGYARSPAAQQRFEEARRILEEALSPEELQAGLANGAAQRLEQAVAYATKGRGRRRRAATGRASLTKTEREVMALAAEGLTNPEIGERLFMNRRTVQTHLRHVFAKLGISSRKQLAQEPSHRGESTSDGGR